MRFSIFFLLSAAVTLCGCGPSNTPLTSCAANGSCPVGMVCGAGNVCVAASTDLGDCDANPIACGGCAADKDCSGATPRCDSATNRCVPCLPQNDNCAAGTHCVAANGGYSCAAACRVDADCPRTDAGVPAACCGGSCLDLASDASNCGACGKACSQLANAAASCSSGVCGIKNCNAGFANCDNLTANGCEANTVSDANNCGLCAKVCAGAPNATAACVASACAITCAMNFADCDGNPQNGCETNTGSDINNCGRCKNSCAMVPNASATCQGGGCVVGTCNIGYGDCNKNPGDGCEANIATDSANCGGCGKACPAVANGTAACKGGGCAVGACNMGFADCNGLPNDGCEASVVADKNNCGACARVCAPANGVGACANSQCSIASCNMGFADCNMMPGDGCESSVASDVNNCGGCGRVCTPAANATVACTNGTCVPGQCKFGFADCDRMPANGCEASLTAIQNCGFCGNQCVAPTNATAGCNAGQCGIGMCNANFGNCDNNLANGCERSLANDTSNCGACNHVCNLANATPLCLGGQCGIGSCNNGYTDCNMNPADGCESLTQSDPMNCGGCNRKCVGPANTTPGCSNNVCSFSCTFGFADCNSNMADGCEVDLRLPAHCGSCNTVCPVPANGTAGCNNGQCGVGMCNMGYADCNGSPNDGCEKSVAADINNCGGCGRVCNLPNATPGCLNSQCGVITCNPGFGDCDGNAQNGCETNFGSDLKNCGGCGVVCAVGDVCQGYCNCPMCALSHAAAECVNNQCVISQCAPGFADCDRVAANGCETNTGTDANNCGACGTVCPVGMPNCGSGKCTTLYVFTGVAQNLPVASLAGWTQCYLDTYGITGTPVATILQACSANQLLMACRPTGANTLTLAAMGPRASVLTDTGTGNTTTIANGVGWYFNSSYSWGFVPAGDPITRNSCDTLNMPDADKRMCWHTGAGNINTGYRCGTTTLNGNNQWERVIYQAP